MTTRAFLLGLLGALVVATATYYNDYVIDQKWFIGQHLPTIVMGLVFPFALGVNPLLGRLRRGWALTHGEIMVAVGLTLVACALPGSGFWRSFGPAVAKPAYNELVQPSWQATGVLGYVPGGPPRIPMGYVTDWPAVVGEVASVADDEVASDDARRAVAWALFHASDAAGQQTWLQAADQAEQQGELDSEMKLTLRRLIERVLSERRLLRLEAVQPYVHEALRQLDWSAVAPAALESWQVQRVNRVVLSEALPEILPPPAGEGALLDHGRADGEAVERYLWGEEGADVPWAALWPTLRMWVLGALFASLCVLMMMVIVHPQWSRRELLPYPIARFVSEITASGNQGQRLPDICRNRVFWCGVALPVAFFVVRGAHTWFGTPDIPSELDFDPLRELFPNISRVQWSHLIFVPRVRFAAIGIAFLLPLSVSFSVGVSTYIYAAIAAMFLVSGVGLDTDVAGADKFAWLRTGGVLGLLLIVAYEGRRYYLSVIARSVGLRLGDAPPRSSVWAARALVACFVGAVLMLHLGGMNWGWACAVLVVQLAVSIVMARVIAETGFFFFSGMMSPAVVMLGLFGFEAIGPTAVVMLTMAGRMFMGNVREAASPFFINALKLGEPTAEGSPRASWGSMAGGGGSGWFVPAAVVALVLSMGVAGYVTLSTQVEQGVAAMSSDASWTWDADRAFMSASRQVREAESSDMLADAIETQGAARLELISPARGALRWAAAGLLAVIVLGTLRLRVPSWPLHPVIIVLLGGWTVAWLGFSFLIGWLIRLGVTRTTGLHGYRTVLPFMMGMVAGEVTMGLGLAVVGWAYYWITGVPPERVSYF